MDLNSILKEIENGRGGNVKTASAQENTMSKTAGANEDAVNTLLKVAADLSGAEKQAELAHAHMMGQAMADAAIARFSMYEGEMGKVASEIGGYTERDVEEATRIGYEAGIKQASAQASKEVSDEDMQKWAAYVQYGEEKLAAAADVLSSEDLVKFAEQEGLTPVLEKMAADYEAGYKQAEAEISELAQTEFLKGAAETEIMVELLKQAQR